MSNPATRSCGNCCTALADFGVRLGQRDILKNIDLHIHCGELTAVIGPNGCGKTTFFKAILGDVPHVGKLRFFHADTNQRFESPKIGYVPQALHVDPGTATTVLDLFVGATSKRALWLGRSSAAREAARSSLAIVDSENLIDRRLGELSGGQAQRVLLALALTPTPDLLLLDEPISGVDLPGMERFYRTVSDLREKYDLSILIASHDLTGIGQIADRILLIMDGAIAMDGHADQVLSSEPVRRIFGYDYAAHHRPSSAGKLLPSERHDYHYEDL